MRCPHGNFSTDSFTWTEVKAASAPGSAAVDALPVEPEKPETGDSKVGGGGGAPLVLFIGQMTFDTSEQDVKLYLQTHGVKGEISVRIPRDAASKRLVFGFEDSLL